MFKSARRSGALVSSILAMAVAGAVWSQQDTQPGTTTPGATTGTSSSTAPTRPGIDNSRKMQFKLRRRPRR